jgi:MoaA/NifB/PqqE/SkfB family radical SAM enzyme
MLKHLGTAFKLLPALLSPPAYLVLYVTNKCDLACSFCFNRKARNKNVLEMTLNEHIQLAQSSGKLFELLVSGGEPFLREDLVDILKAYLRYCKPTILTIPTSGGHPDRIENLLNELGPSLGSTRLHINLSVDDIEEAHDRLRGRHGLSCKVIESSRVIHRLKKQWSNIWAGVITVYGDHNKTHLAEIINWVKTNLRPDFHDVGVERDTIIKSSPDEIHRMNEHINFELTAAGMMLTGVEKGVHRAFQRYFKESVDAGHPVTKCTAGRALIVVTADGKVYPCEPFWLEPQAYPRFEHVSMGELRDFDGRLDLLMRSPHARNIQAGIRRGDCSCLWGCALYSNILFTPNGWVRIVRALSCG